MDQEDAINAAGRHDHLVQFYSSSQSLAETAGHFIAEGLRNGESVIVVATSGHRAHFDAALAAAGVDLSSARGAGRLIEPDADRTLALFMSEGQPLWARFQATVGKILDEAAARPGGVRVYGEMVDVLWQAGNLSAATRLEIYWNQILSARRIPLFCAYRADLLHDAVDHSQLEHILRTHSHLLPAHGALESAVSQALVETVGKAQAEALRPLIAATQTPGAKLPWAEAAVFWLKNNLPHLADRVLGRARRIMEVGGVPT